MEARAITVSALLLATLALPAAAPQSPPPDEAPSDLEWPDVALSVRLPGIRAPGGGPVLTSEAVFVATSKLDGPYPGAPSELSETNAVWRVDLATGAASTIAEPTWGIGALASDGADLFVAGNYTAASYAFDGAERWTVQLPRTIAPDARYAYYVDGVVRDATFFVLWTEWTDASGDSWNVAALDAATGALRWAWSSHAILAPPPQDGDVMGRLGHGKIVASTFALNEGRFTVIGDFVYVTGFAYGTGGPWESYLFVLEAATGKVLDAMTSEADTSAHEWYLSAICGPTFGTVPRREVPNIAPVPVGSERVVYYKLEAAVQAYNPAQQTVLWTMNDSRRDDDTSMRDFGSLGVARGDDLFMPFVRTLKRIATAPQQEVVWTIALPSNESWTRAGMRFTDTTLYGLSVGDPPPGCENDQTRRDGGTIGMLLWPANRTVVRALDPATGAQRWAFEATTAFTVPWTYSLALHAWTMSEGRIALAGYDGSVIVLGRTLASPNVVVPSIDAYPAVDAPVVVDLSGSAPGIAGGLTAYRAIWGDGTDSGWQESPTLAHAYARGGDHEARFLVQGEGNQSASATKTFHVGALPPAGPPATLAQRAAAILSGPIGWGLLETLVAITLPVLFASYARRRSRLAREVRAAERAFTAASGDRTSAIAVMIERRAHASRLLLKRKLTTSEHSALVSRIAELEGTLGGPGLEAAPGDILPGTLLLRRYKVIRVLGEGAYGRAYLADDTTVARQVVLKILRQRMSEEGLREARAIGAIRHPNVVTLFDVAQLGDQPLLVMEYAEGGSLRDRIARGAISASEFGALATGLLNALDAVHAAGAVHRDVKPSNVLLAADGSVKLADFGVARLSSAERTLGEETVGGPVGTARYMSPEQARGRRVTPRSDLYSAALTLYEAWTGAHFFGSAPGESAAEMQVRVAGAPPFDQDVGPLPLREWFARALAPDPADRFADAAQMRDALRAAWTRPQ